MIFLSGPANTGKTSRLCARLTALIDGGVRPDRILTLVPQQAQADRFRAAAASARGKTRGQPWITTFYGLAQQHVRLFFPLVAPGAGFTSPQQNEPIFIDVEAAQFFLNQIVSARSADFEDLRLYRPRLLTQILDGMNKAATSGFGLAELAKRLGDAWPGDPQRIASYQRAQEVAQRFRAFCLARGVLDFSLTIDLFAQHLLKSQTYRDYIAAHYRHVLADNIEEMPPVAHDCVAQLLTSADSAMLAQDDPGGYRLFLGADPASAAQLREFCDPELFERTEPEPVGPVPAFGRRLAREFSAHRDDAGASPELDPPVQLGSEKYWTQMVDWVVARIVAEVETGAAQAEDITILAPFVDDVLRFELTERLGAHGIGVRSLRPSRPLYDHPVTRAFTAWARLARPAWANPPAAPELARALSIAIDELDIVRAQLIAEAALRVGGINTGPPLLEDQALWNRVGMRFRERYEVMRGWVAAAAAAPKAAPLDLLWQQLFDQLTQPGFGLRADRDGALAADKLIRSARGFREVFEALGDWDFGPAQFLTEIPVLGLSERPLTPPDDDIGLAFVRLLAEGILASQYAPERRPVLSGEAAQPQVMLATTYAYLTGDFRSKVQFWLDVNSTGWYERIYQPLTHPYVLARSWKGGSWGDAEEQRSADDMIRRVLLGLTARCGERLYLASSQIGLNGQDEAGPLARALQKAMRGAQFTGGPA